MFAAFAGGDLPGPKLRQPMIDDVLDMLAYYTWTEPAGVATLFTSELSFARDARLAQLYGVAAWDGSSAPPRCRPGSARACSRARCSSRAARPTRARS